MSNNRFFNPFANLENMACDWNCYREMAQNNWRALNAAGQVLTDNMQAMMRRQADEVRQAQKHNVDCWQRTSHCNSAEEAQRTCQHQLNQCAQDATQYVRDMAQLAVKTTNDMLDIFQQRVNELNAEMCKAHPQTATARAKK